MIAIVLAVLLSQAEPLSLRLAAVGRDAVFVDQASIAQTGAERAFRVLRIVVDEPIAGERFFGGWQHVAIDCRQRTFTGLAFASIRESGAFGPLQPSRRIEAYPIARGSIEEGLRAAVCEDRYAYGDRAASIADAARIGRQKIEDEIDAQIEGKPR